MSTIDKLGIIGMRSYDPNHLEHIEFFKPLTIIWGHNGSGKTTIIECLKLITSGSYPPNSMNGKTFIMDPKLCGRPEIKSQIKLKFKALNKKQIIAMRAFQLTNLKSSKLEMKTVEQVLKTRDLEGNIVSINHTCAEMEKQVPELLGVSRAVLENVIFCHQEDSLWPFGDTATLKEIFDELFDTTMYTKLHETMRGIHKNIAKNSKELQTKLVFFKKDFDNHVYKKSKVLKDTENLNEDIKKIDEMEKVVRLWEEKKKDFENLEQEIKDAEIELNLIKYKKDNHQKDLNSLRSSLAKEFEADSIDGLRKCKEILVKKYKDFEHEIKDKRFRLDTQKGLAELKRRELDDLLKAEQNDTNLMNEMRKSREELAFSLKIQQNSFETEDIFNERVISQAENTLTNAEKEGQEALASYEKEETRISQELEAKTQEITELRLEIERQESEFKQKKEKTDENTSKIQEFQEKLQKKQEFEKNIREIELGLKDYQEDLELTEQALSQAQEKQRVLTNQIKRVTDLKRLQSIKGNFDENQARYKSLLDNRQSNQRKFTEGLKFLDLLEKDLPSMKGLHEKPLEEIFSTLQKCQETCKLNIAKQEANKSKLQEKLREILAYKSVSGKELQEIEKKLKTLEKAFQRIGLSSLLKSNQEVLGFEAQYKEIKQDLHNAEKALAIMEFTQNDLQNFLLTRSKEKSRCEFCEQPLSKEALQKLEHTVQQNRQPKADKHQEALREKIAGIRKEKEVLKKRKADYEEFSRLKRRANELQQGLDSQETERLDISKETECLEASLSKLKHSQEKFQELLELYAKIEELQGEADGVKVILEDLEKENPGIGSLKFSAEEQEVLANARIFDALEESIAEIKKFERRKASLTSDSQKYQTQKSKMQEFLTIIEGEKGKMLALEGENAKLKEIMQKIREDLPLKIAKIKKLDGDKKALDEELKTVKKQGKFTEKEIQKKKTLIEFLLPQFKQKVELTKVINRRKISKKDEEELKTLKNQLNKDLRIMNDVIKEYEEFIEEKQKLLQEKDHHFQLIDQNIKLKEMESEIQVFEEEAKKKIDFLANKRSDVEQLNAIKAKIEEEKAKYVSLKEKTRYCLDNLEKENDELKLKASQVEETYIESLINHEIQQGILHDLDIYVKTLEATLLRYHRTKMEEINKIIADTWRDVYNGDDIIKIEIKSDEEVSQAKKSKNYNYRLVYYTKQNKEMDMKGRCSMGQKVLASIVIRLALAEAFGVNCGILALDEPTTNLDRGNVKRLAQELGSLIEARKGNENFQLIVITHDKEFVKMLNEYADKYYEISKNEQGFSNITLKNIDFM